MLIEIRVLEIDVSSASHSFLGSNIGFVELSNRSQAWFFAWSKLDYERMLVIGFTWEISTDVSLVFVDWWKIWICTSFFLGKSVITKFKYVRLDVIECFGIAFQVCKINGINYSECDSNLYWFLEELWWEIT